MARLGYYPKILLSLYRFIYETDRHNGIAELLEVLGRSELSFITFYTFCAAFLQYMTQIMVSMEGTMQRLQLYL